ncbi:MAG TPA: sulfatase-like hydrolase/transferase [Thermoguttaceae bacterium]|nr:sulfatase-like hydrolase/transferase [Thermoguttaceae bacterium]
MSKVTSLTLAALLLAFPAALRADDEPAGQPLNLLLIVTDQQTAGALSCAGNPYVKTANLDQLAARGVRFGKSYCAYPLCCPSRGSLFTSRMPHELGIYGNFDAELSEKGVPTMGELFRAAGYETAYAGKWHVQVPFPAFKSREIPGFAVLPLAGRDPHTIDMTKEGKGLTVDPNTADAAIEFLRRSHEKPFLLTVSVLNPHDICEYSGCEAFRSMLPDDPAQLPPARPNLRDTDELPSALQRLVAQHADWSELQWREYLWVYCRLVEKADTEVGRVLAALDQTGLSARTVVVFTSDHGEMMGSHRMVTKQKLYEESVAVPLIVAPPGAAAAVDTQHLVSGLDVLPTLLDYAGIAAPASLEGRSLRPLVEGKAVPWRQFVVSETVSGAEARMVRTARYKYVLFSRGDNREQFFDMEADPVEMKNLIGDVSLAGEVERHRGLLKQWMEDTQDTFTAQRATHDRTDRASATRSPPSRPWSARRLGLRARGFIVTPNRPAG